MWKCVSDVFLKRRFKKCRLRRWNTTASHAYIFKLGRRKKKGKACSIFLLAAKRSVDSIYQTSIKCTEGFGYITQLCDTTVKTRGVNTFSECGGRTHIILLWVWAWKGERSDNDPLLLLKRFHQQDPALFSPAEGMKNSRSVTQKLGSLKNKTGYNSTWTPKKTRPKQTQTAWMRPYLCRALAVQFLRFLSGSLTCPSRQHWPQTNFIFRLRGRPLPAPPTSPPTGPTPPAPTPSPPTPRPPIPPADRLLVGWGMWIGWKRERDVSYSHMGQRSSHILQFQWFVLTFCPDLV